MIDYGNFSSSLKNLELQYGGNYLNLDEELSQLMKEAVAESVVQRFEIFAMKLRGRRCTAIYRRSWALPRFAIAPEPTLRIADDNFLLASGFGQWRPLC